MTIDLQPLRNELPNQGANSVSDLRDRYDGTQRASSAERFDSMLDQAEVRWSGGGRESSDSRTAPASHRQWRGGAHAVTAAERDKRSVSVENRHERSRVEDHPASGKEAVRTSDHDREKDDVTVPQSKPDEGNTVRPDQLLTAVVLPIVSSEPIVVQATAASDQAALSETAPVLSASALTGEAVAPTAPASPAPVAQKKATDEDIKGDSVQTQATPTKITDIHGTAAGTVDASVPFRLQGQGVTDDTVMSLSKLSAGESGKGPDGTMAVEALLRAGEPKISPAGVGDQIDLASVPDVTMRHDPFSESRGAWSSEQFSKGDHQRFSDAFGEDASSKTHAQLLDDGTFRPMVLDRAGGMGQSVSPSNDDAFGRSDAGTVTIHRASESERMTELRGASPFAQTVTVDLDPLDMGPLRIRVMMSDQTVHAHIRTEHGELGQGLLQQGQSLESSLKTTGLEMGMLRVTVDQQQGRGDNAWMFQQQQGRSVPASGQPATPGEEERIARTGDSPHYNSGGVSIFA
ncbi:MAG: hypothetical protein OJF47_000789 [Nitrospira sp.]|jgi:hypothetical protein|nr:MAG: hypothetical protein OJF47_000789 [Nitrospira sp.]